MNNFASYIVLFFSSFVLCILFTPLVKKFAAYIHAIDVPNLPRKIHKTPIPLLGGVGIILTFTIVSIVYIVLFHAQSVVLPLRFYLGIFVASMVLLLGGVLDDKYQLTPLQQVMFPLVATLVIILARIGIGISQITNPIGMQPIRLDFIVLGVPFSVFFVYIYILGMTYTTKFLDGLDGLVTGISLIASLTLFTLSLMPKINQPITASLSIILAGALAGFLLFNFNPASIFLGEAGATFTGFMLATLSVLLGGKIATAILVMGVPILDIAWVITRRLWYGKSPFVGDRKHLHLRLLDIGFSQKQTAIILYSLSTCFGATAIILQSMGKLIALIVLFIVMILLGLFSVFAYKVKSGATSVNS